MKKVTYILAGLLVMLFVGCGGEAGSASSGVSTQAEDAVEAVKNDTNAYVSNNIVKNVKGLTQFPAVPAIPES